MTTFYQDKRKATNDLINWINDNDRLEFSKFCRDMLLKYGFGVKTMKKLLEDNFPSLTIEDDKLADARKEA